MVRWFRIAILSLAWTGIGLGSLWAQEAVKESPAHLTVTGQGQFNAVPEIAFLTATVKTSAASLEEAMKLHSPRATRVTAEMESLKAEGLEIERSDFDLNETFRQSSPQMPNLEKKDYLATTGFRLKVTKLSALNALISRMAGTGMIEISSLSYGVLDERKASNEARKFAVQDAKSQASILAEEAGISLGSIMEIKDSMAGARPDTPYQLAMARQAFVGVTPPSSLTFNASVTVSWRIVPKP